MSCIFERSWWEDEQGNTPEAFTVITVKDVTSGRYRPKQKSDLDFAIKHLTDIKQKYVFTIFPDIVKGANMPIDLQSTFEKFEKEYMKFDRIENPPSYHPDLCAFLLLEKLVPSNLQKLDIISAAEHDKIWLSVNGDDFANVATEDDVLYLVRCGVQYDSDGNCFCMNA